MSDKYQAPVYDGFVAGEALAVRTKDGNNTRRTLLQTWKNAYERFWQTPRTHGNRALTTEQVQAMIDVDQTVVLDILTDSAAFVQFMVTAHPDVLVAADDEDEPLLPARYTTSPYEFDPTDYAAGTLTLTELKQDWQTQEAG